MGNAAEFIAGEYEVTREAMDQFALGSHQKAVEAQETGRFKAEIVPVQIRDEKGKSQSWIEMKARAKIHRWKYWPSLNLPSKLMEKSHRGIHLQ